MVRETFLFCEFVLRIQFLSSLQRQTRTKKTSVPCLDGYGTCTSREWENMIRPQPIMRRKMSDPDIHHGNFHVLSNLVRNSFQPQPISTETNRIIFP